jgi:uncharacterized protein (TIGR03086 family)
MTTSIISRALDQLVTLLGDVTPDDLGRPTPCAEWTVADLSDHIVNSTAGMVTMAQGGEPDWASNPHHEDPAAALREQAGLLVDALSAEDASFPAGMAAGELAIHAYDLATGLGRPTSELDQEVAEVGYGFMSESLTDDNRGNAFRPAQPAPADADAYQRLAAFAGRSV